MRPRIDSAQPPYSPAIQTALDNIMPKGVAPLTLFTTLARDERLFERFFAAGLLDKGNLSLRDREIVIHRITGACGSEYEWGVHAAFFAPQAKLTDEQLYSLVYGSGQDVCWDSKESLILDMCDQLQRTSTLSDELWKQLRATYSENALIELLMLAGYYRTVSYLTNGLKLPLEAFGRRFPARKP